MKRIKQDPRWADAHVRLKKLYEERAPENMTQEEFGQTFGIGTQGMVWQYLNGWCPLNFEAAAKFAKGLNCTIADISPAMAKALRVDIFPVLGRAAAIALLSLMFSLSPRPAHAGYFAASHDGLCIMLNAARTILVRLVRWLTATRSFLAGCRNIYPPRYVLPR